MAGRLLFAEVSAEHTYSSLPYHSYWAFDNRAGVLYMFNDAQHRIPSLVIGMYECKGARRAATSSRPHCFELMLKSGFMQLAAPDEYVASDWLQALVQAASGVSNIRT